MAMIGDTFNDLSWRVAPAGEIIDQDGGMVAGDSLTRMRSLMMRQAGTDRGQSCPAIDTNSGAECIRRQKRQRQAQIDHVRIFGR